MPDRNNTNGNEYLTAIDLIWFFIALFSSLFSFGSMHLIYLLDVFLLFLMLSEHNNNQLYFFPSAATKRIGPIVTQNRFEL